MTNGFSHSLSRGGARLALVYCCTGALALGCGSSPMGGDTWPKGNVVFADSNNYTSDTSLTIPVVTAAPGADLNICWDALMKDLLCHNIEGTNDIDNVAFLKIPNMDKTKVSDALAVGQLDENLVAKYGDYHTDQGTTKCAKLSTFKLGSSIVPATDFVAPTGSMNITYMLLFANGTTPGVGSKAMLFLDPTGTADSVNAMDACSNNVLHFTATLGAPMTISATDSSKWHVDWSQLTHDSFGKPVLFTKISSVLIGYYQGKTAADLMTNFKDIEQIATTLWEVPVAPGARDVKLGDAKVRGGTTPFPGFTQTDGVYAMAVLCSKCQVPAPVMLSILQPQ